MVYLKWLKLLYWAFKGSGQEQNEWIIVLGAHISNNIFSNYAYIWSLDKYNVLNNFMFLYFVHSLFYILRLGRQMSSNSGVSWGLKMGVLLVNFMSIRESLCVLLLGPTDSMSLQPVLFHMWPLIQQVSGLLTRLFAELIQSSWGGWSDGAFIWGIPDGYV